MLPYFSVKLSRSKIEDLRGRENVFEYGLKHTALLVLNIT